MVMKSKLFWKAGLAIRWWRIGSAKLTSAAKCLLGGGLVVGGGIGAGALIALALCRLVIGSNVLALLRAEMTGSTLWLLVAGGVVLLGLSAWLGRELMILDRLENSLRKKAIARKHAVLMLN